MNKTRRVSLFIFVLGLLFFLGLVFSAWTVPHILLPVAGSVWLFLRIFILSVDQKYYWGLTILLALLWVFYRFFRQEEPVIRKEYASHSEALSIYTNWQSSLIRSKKDASQRQFLRRKIILLLSSYYIARQDDSDQATFQQALETRQIPLPDKVYNFLFVPEPAPPRRLSIPALSHAYRCLVRRTPGLEGMDFNKIIEELLRFLENTSEN